MSYFNKFFGIYGDSKDRFCYFLGRKINLLKKKKLTIEEIRKELNKTKTDILLGVQRSINIAMLHQKTFGEFKNKHQGKTIVLIGAGPSLNYFEPIENAIYVGLNRTFLKENIKFDYLFSIDKIGLKSKDYDYFEDFINYKGNNCIKFMGDQNLDEHFQIPESTILKANAKRYKTTSRLTPNRYTLDIDSEPLGNFASVSLQAMQFILYTNPKKVYIVGIDCSASKCGHFTGATPDLSFRNESMQRNDLANIDYWAGIKKFADMYYPETEIISINPVGLKGIFKDIYTQKYIESLKENEKNN